MLTFLRCSSPNGETLWKLNWTQSLSPGDGKSCGQCADQDHRALARQYLIVNRLINVHNEHKFGSIWFNCVWFACGGVAALVVEMLASQCSEVCVCQSNAALARIKREESEFKFICTKIPEGFCLLSSASSPVQTLEITIIIIEWATIACRFVALFLGSSSVLVFTNYDYC